MKQKRLFLPLLQIENPFQFSLLNLNQSNNDYIDFLNLEESMSLFSKIKKLIKFSDFFYSSQLLRYEDQQEYRTLTGGIISLAITITILIGFANMIVSTFDRSDFTTNKFVTKNEFPPRALISTEPDSNFMFAIEIWFLNITEPQRYFDVQFSRKAISGQLILDYSLLELEPCTREHWKSMPSLLQKFDTLNMNGWMCPPIGQTYDIYGKYSSTVYSIFELTVSSCKNQTDPTRPCAPQQTIDALFVTFSNQFYFTFYFTNTIINIDKKDCKSYYLQDQNYVIFGDKIGSESYIFFTDYTIQTDVSIWPFEDVKSEKGLMVESTSINHPFQSDKNGRYASLFLIKSDNSIKYTRAVSKISSVFSFIGGMISAISAALFFIKFYTQISFELSLSFSIFSPETCNQTSRSLQMNPFRFIKYYLFVFFRKMGLNFESLNLHFLSQCQQEITKQLDVKSLVKRLIFIEHCLTYIFEDYQLDCLQMKIPKSPGQIREIREKCESIVEIAISNSSEIKETQGKKVLITVGEAQCSKASPNQIFSAEIKNQNSQNILAVPNPKRNSLMIEQILTDQIKSEAHENKKSNNSIKCRSKKNIVFNDYEKQQVKRSHLNILYANAEQGNEISKRIWQSLPKDIKGGINPGPRYSKGTANYETYEME